MGLDDQDDSEEVLGLYKCKESPLHYIIEPRCTVEVTDKDKETTIEEFDPIL